MSIFNRAEIVHENFMNHLRNRSAPNVFSPGPTQAVDQETDLTWARARQMFESQLASRQVDIVAREMKEEGTGYYTISSAGHEGNAVFAEVLRHDDPAIVHYRSGAFMLHRVFHHLGERPLYDLMLSITVSAEDPVSGGRHKIFGDPDTFVPPQTSTIASHLPRSVGMAFSIDHAGRMEADIDVPDDAIVACSFGDASVNHSVFQGALNSTLWAGRKSLPVPVLLICEDNGWGISVPTPDGWIEQQMKSRPGLTYVSCDGRDLRDTYETAREAVSYVRSERKPVFLHMKTVRLLGHSGADLELEYRSKEAVERTEEQDPLLAVSDWLIENGVLTPEEILDLYRETGKRVRELGEKAAETPHLSSADEVMEPLASFSADDVKREADRFDYEERRRELFGDQEKLPENRDPNRPLATQLNRGLCDLLAKYPDMTVFGEDVGRKGGVYGVTQKLQERAGSDRVFDTMLDETTILGLALGMSIHGLLPVPEVQYLAYVYNAYDQLRGEAGSQSFFSSGQFTNGLVVRIASFGYQEGFGGHFHNDNGFAALREIPGIVIAVPSRGDDAVEMLRTCTAMARVDGRVVLFLEPIALYHRKDLHEEGDGKWNCSFPEPGTSTAPGEPRVYREGDGRDLTILTYGNGVPMSLNTARRLRDRDGIGTRIVDLRWLAPLNREVLVKEASNDQPLLIVDEARRTGGPSEQIMSILVEEQLSNNTVRVASEDCYVPTGPASDEILVTEEQIERVAEELLRSG